LGYRPDIQLLRAVAVSLVILYHLGAPISGFLGVDIFFVVSGYLMQSLYGQGVPAKDFYLRRARRLLPAYFGLIFATLAACALITIPSDFQQAAEQSMFAAGFASNIGFWLQNSYFDESQFRPLLHLWSLGVEIQFYLIFPLLLFVSKRRWVLPLLCALSLAACLAALMVSPKLSFFMLPLRVWEFIIGMIAARMSLKARPALGLLAVLAMIDICFLPFNGQALSVVWGHPGLGAVATTLLTAAVLTFRLPATENLLSRGAQRIGDVSYSLYLVHFPIIVLWNYQPFGGTRLGYAPISLIAVATVASYFVLERSKLFTWPRSVAVGSIIMALGLLLPSIQVYRYGAADRTIFATTHDRATYRCGKLFRVLHPKDTFCPIAEGGPTLLLVGDSHADAIKLSVAAVAKRHGWGTYLSVDNAPLLSKRFDINWLKREAVQRHAGLVVLHYASNNLTPELIEQAHQALGDRLLLITPTHMFRESAPRALWEGHLPAPLADNANVARYLKTHPEVRRIDVGNCCRPQDYWDEGHLTLSGARMLEPRLEQGLAILQPKHQ
jgi:peptidoglycan/LPS O-acetylase OafA/YrhL